MQIFNFIKSVKAAGPTGEIGEVAPPDWIKKWMVSGDEPGQALFRFVSKILIFMTVIAGIYFIIQLITAGYMYISSNGDPKKIDMASQKIMQSLIGIIIVASAVTLGTVIGRIAGIDITDFSF